MSDERQQNTYPAHDEGDLPDVEAHKVLHTAQDEKRDDDDEGPDVEAHKVLHI